MTYRILSQGEALKFSPVMLPTFGTAGHLPAGIHNCTWESLATLVCFNPHRQTMWSQLANFLLWPVHSNDFYYAYLGGDYVSVKRIPRDIDLVLETAMPYGPESFAAISPFFVMGLDKIKESHRVHLHFWMENAPPNVWNSTTFYQSPYREIEQQRLDPSRGLIRLDLKDSKILAALREHATDDQANRMCKF